MRLWKKMTKAEILQKMSEMVDALASECEREEWRRTIKKVKSKTKAEIISVHEELECLYTGGAEVSVGDEDV